MQKGNTLIFLLIGIVVLAVASGAFYLGTKKSSTLQDTVSRQNPVIIPSTSLQGNNKPTPDTTPQNDETANWKTYTNTKYGYSIKSPPDWIVAGGDNGNIKIVDDINPENINLILPAKPCSLADIKNPYDCGGKEEIVITVQDNPRKLPLKEFGNSYIGPGARDEYKPITLDSKSGLAVGYGDSTTFVFLENNSKVYIIEDSPSNLDTSIFNKILSTFKFL